MPKFICSKDDVRLVFLRPPTHTNKWGTRVSSLGMKGGWTLLPRRCRLRDLPGPSGLLGRRAELGRRVAADRGTFL